MNDQAPSKELSGNEPWETTVSYGRADLTLHALVREAYKVACLIERCGGSVELTRASSAAFALCEALSDHMQSTAGKWFAFAENGLSAGVVADRLQKCLDRTDPIDNPDIAISRGGIAGIIRALHSTPEPQPATDEQLTALVHEVWKFANGSTSLSMTQAVAAIRRFLGAAPEPRLPLNADITQEEAWRRVSDRSWCGYCGQETTPASSQPPEAWHPVIPSKPTEADGEVVLVFTGDAYSVEYPDEVNGAEHIAWMRITPYTRPTKESAPSEYCFSAGCKAQAKDGSVLCQAHYDALPAPMRGASTPGERSE